MKIHAAYKKTTARIADVNRYAVSKVTLKQYKEPLSIERKGGNGRKKNLPTKTKQVK